MDAVGFCPGFRLSSLSIPTKLSFPFLSPKELADGPTRLASKNDYMHTLSTRADANIKGNSSRKSGGDSKSKRSPQSSDEDNRSFTKEEIMALFRRIQSSIAKSKEDPISNAPKRKSSNPSQEEYKPSTESVLKILRQSQRQKKGETSSKEKNERVSPAVADTNSPPRPPSNFVKRSPIPPPMNPKDAVFEETNTVADAETELESFEEMKVAELKELVKSRGIKGYSKLKKTELIELLKSAKDGSIS